MDDISLEADLHYGEADGTPLRLDLWRPQRPSATPTPAIVWIHGGGWEAGDKELDPVGPQVSLAARDGFVLASVAYRLSDRATFPAQLHDVKAAIRWLRANAAELGIDPGRIGVWGHSAGGHLAALLGTTGDLPELEGESGSPGYSSRVQAVIPISPPTDFFAFPPGWGGAEPYRATSKLVGGPLETRREVVAMANPITHVRSDVPPFLIIHGEADDVVPVLHAELLADALQDAGGDVKLLRLPQADHGLAAAALEIGWEAAWSSVAEHASAFFRTHLRHSPAA